LGSPVFVPRVFVVPVGKRIVFAVADCAHPRCIDAEADQILPRCAGPAGAKRKVVFLGAALITVPFDRDLKL
jgi:hypothetical protein